MDERLKLVDQYHAHARHLESVAVLTASKVVLNTPVSRKCNFMLLATGDYDRKQVENFIAILQLNVELGAFDVHPLEQGVGEQSLEQAVARGEVLPIADSASAGGPFPQRRR
jgi:hypothetical protein